MRNVYNLLEFELLSTKRFKPTHLVIYFISIFVGKFHLV